LEVKEILGWASGISVLVAALVAVLGLWTNVLGAVAFGRDRRHKIAEQAHQAAERCAGTQTKEALKRYASQLDVVNTVGLRWLTHEQCLALMRGNARRNLEDYRKARAALSVNVSGPLFAWRWTWMQRGRTRTVVFLSSLLLYGVLWFLAIAAFSALVSRPLAPGMIVLLSGFSLAAIAAALWLALFAGHLQRAASVMSSQQSCGGAAIWPKQCG